MPQTLLLADDSLTIQRVIELTFAGEDIKVVAVSDGDQAIARLDTEPPDIVLADVGMPGRTGYDVAQHVKQSPALAHIPVVLLTGAFEPVDQVRAASVGCDAVLAKPFDPQLVIGRVRELLGRPPKALGTPADTAAAAVAAAAAAAEASASFTSPIVAVEPAPRDPRVDDYFDRLDAAFASLSNPPSPSRSLDAPSQDASDLDWLNLYPSDDAAGPVPPAAGDVTPSSVTSDVVADSGPTFDSPAAPVEAVSRHEPPAAASQPDDSASPAAVVALPPAARSLPPLADAFAAILSAEQNALGVRPTWPLPIPVEAAPPPPPPEPVITDDVVERIAQRVIAQLSDRVVRETVAQIASELAERLVREEIDRIKASIAPADDTSAS